MRRKTQERVILMTNLVITTGVLFAYCFFYINNIVVFGSPSLPLSLSLTFFLLLFPVKASIEVEQGYHFLVFFSLRARFEQQVTVMKRKADDLLHSRDDVVIADT